MKAKPGTPPPYRTCRNPISRKQWSMYGIFVTRCSFSDGIFNICIAPTCQTCMMLGRCNGRFSRQRMVLSYVILYQFRLNSSTSQTRKVHIQPDPQNPITGPPLFDMAPPRHHIRCTRCKFQQILFLSAFRKPDLPRCVELGIR
jgi:hypothetical protein